MEDGHVLTEIAIVGIVEAVFDEISQQHLHPPWSISP
jgi:hypothetical protein